MHTEAQTIHELPGVDDLLRLLLRSTELRIALIARVSKGAWTCCAVIDEADFGLEVGSSLDVSTTY